MLITTLSIALAEVSIASSPWGLVFPPAWLLLVPVYGAQPLLVAVIVLRHGRRPTLTALWCAGVVMGLYEFYITQVLWTPPWVDPPYVTLIDPTTFVVVSMFWHPFVATILPIVLAEQIMAREPRLAGLFPRRIRAFGRRGRWVALVFLAVVSGGMYGQVLPAWTAIALGVSALVVWGVVVWARRAGPVEDFAAEALPNRAGVRWIVAILVVFFGIFIVVANTSEPVSGARQLAAVVCYAFFVLLAWRNLRHRRVAPTTRLAALPVGVWPAVAYVAIASAMALTPVFPTVVATVAVWVVGGATALTMFGLAVVGAIRRRESYPGSA